MSIGPPGISKHVALQVKDHDFTVPLKLHSLRNYRTFDNSRCGQYTDQGSCCMGKLAASP